MDDGVPASMVTVVGSVAAATSGGEPGVPDSRRDVAASRPASTTAVPPRRSRRRRDGGSTGTGSVRSGSTAGVYGAGGRSPADGPVGGQQMRPRRATPPGERCRLRGLCPDNARSALLLGPVAGKSLPILDRKTV